MADFVHTYYLVMLALSIAALSGIGAVALWQEYRRTDWRRWLLPASLVGMAIVQAVLLRPFPGWNHWLTPLIVGLSVLLARRALRPIRAALGRQRDFAADAAHAVGDPTRLDRAGSGRGGQAAQQDALAQALAQNSHLPRLVGDLSLLARADSGAVAVELAPIDLAAVLRAAIDGVTMLAEDRGVLLHVEAPAALQMPGDQSRLRQLLLILLDNALQHTPDDGAIVVRLEHHGGQVRLQVRDSGPGIDPRHLPHLFDRFFPADHQRYEGSGLGLAIARWIAEAHGGQIVGANASGGGALFTVALPAPRP